MPTTRALAALACLIAAPLAAQTQTEADAWEAAIRKKCGADLMKVRVGMKFARVRECSGDFKLAGEDAEGEIYKAQHGRVWVRDGVVVKWLAN